MHKLLNANYFRLKKDIIFWLLLLLIVGIAIFTVFRYCSNSMLKDTITLDKLINEIISYIGLFIAIFVSIFIGKEYSNGCIRNKIIVRT